MKTVNFPFRNNVTLIGGGESSQQILEQALTHAPTLVAADGGAKQALAWGKVPQLVIGDMDSLDASSIAALPAENLHRVSEQDSTDFDKALRMVDAPLILGVGFMGGRLDHQLACLNALARYPGKRCVLVGEVDLCFHVPAEASLDLPPGSRLSLFPMAEVVANATGLVHPVEALKMSPSGRVGTSNEVGPGGQVSLEFDRPGMLVITPRAGLAAVLRALQTIWGKGPISP